MVGKGVLGMGSEKGLGGFQQEGLALNIQCGETSRQRKLQERSYLGHEYFVSLHQAAPQSQGLLGSDRR